MASARPMAKKVRSWLVKRQASDAVIWSVEMRSPITSSYGSSAAQRAASALVPHPSVGPDGVSTDATYRRLTRRSRASTAKWSQ